MVALFFYPWGTAFSSGCTLDEFPLFHQTTSIRVGPADKPFLVAGSCKCSRDVLSGRCRTITFQFCDSKLQLLGIQLFELSAVIFTMLFSDPTPFAHIEDYVVVVAKRLIHPDVPVGYFGFYVVRRRRQVYY